MPSSIWAARLWAWLVPLRVVSRFCRLLLVAFAAGLGPPPPPPFRHEDEIAWVSEDDGEGRVRE